MKFWIILLILLSGTGGWFAWHTWGHQEKTATYRTVKVERGDVIQIVRATGTVQPVKLVQVGTQVNGIVRKLNADFNSHVKAGDVVAQIDPAVYQANLSQAEANLTHSQASVDEARANLLKASNDLARASALAKNELLAPADLDAAVASDASAVAELKVALAQVRMNEATLQLARANLSYTTIITPVDGTVVSRNFDEGQTVVASMSAQTIFTVATDLHTVLINASVPEADIGTVAQGQKVIFNVDAYPTSFTGAVDQVRIASSTIQNVVTYPVMVRAENPHEKLFPGMTANISCIIAERTNVLKVLNTALRFKPDKGRKIMTSPPADSEMPRDGIRKARLWVLTPEGSLEPIRVKLGISDGTWTEVISEEVQENLEVVSAILDTGSKDAVVNPFLPAPAASQPRPPRM